MTPEDDRTRVIGNRGVGTPNNLGASAAVEPSDSVHPASNNVLPRHTRLAEFEIIDLIGEGGFGIVYLALDHSLERQVALKEYMPSALASRGAGLNVTVKSQRHNETFQAGLRSFVNEAKLLAHFDHPALVKVHRFWEANGTAYMVMPYYEGVTLKQALSSLPERPTQDWLSAILEPLIDALTLMHEEQCFHRDIAPDNLLILPGGRPVLLDFGAARRVIGDMTQALTVILKPGFAPVEQYAEAPEMKQGPWTDVYALAALIYYSIAGRAPVASVARMMNDKLVPATEIGRGHYSEGFLAAVDAALVVRPEQRTQSIRQFKDALGLQPPDRAYTTLTTASFADERAQTPTKLTRTESGASHQTLPGTKKPMTVVPAHRSSRLYSRWLLLPALLLTLASAAGIGWYLHYSRITAVKPADQPARFNDSQEGKSANTATASPSPEIAPPTATQGPLPGSTAIQTAGEKSQGDPSAPAAAFSPGYVHELLFNRRSADWNLSASVSPQIVEIDKDFLKMKFQSERDGFVYLFMLGSNTQDWWLIFPNGKDRANRIAAGEELELPRKTWPLQAGGPPGISRFLILVSAVERDFSASGLKLSKDFGRYDLSAAAKAFQESTDPASLFAGKIICSQGQANCSSAYGAAQFQIEEIARRQMTNKPSAKQSNDSQIR